jgi:acetyltransferase-like isoleucine patch superfamily enzyme
MPAHPLRLALLAVTALLPGPLKRLVLRLVFGYRIGRGVRIGLSLIDARRVVLGDGTWIGHGNLIIRVGELRTGRDVRIGMGNIIRGGDRVVLEDYSTIIRFNVLNAIPDHDATTAPVSELLVGRGAVVVAGHRLDFTDRIVLGRNVIVAGRNSSLWTHNRQRTAPIVIGDYCYLGSEVRLAPGSALADCCILGLGAVLTKPIPEARCLVAGVPARVVRKLTEADLASLLRKTRADMPDDTPRLAEPDDVRRP